MNKWVLKTFLSCKWISYYRGKKRVFKLMFESLKGMEKTRRGKGKIMGRVKVWSEIELQAG